MHFFFDVTANGSASSDTIGSELASFNDMRIEAIRSLLAIAMDEATEADDQQFNINVRTSDGSVYRAEVSFKGGM